jgi:hypothetical protein
LLIAGFVTLVTWGKRNLTIAQVSSLSIVLALLITTHIWPYDQLLLALPVILMTLELAENGRLFLLNSSIILTLDLLAVVSFMINMQAENEIASTTLTVAVLGLVLWWIFSNPGRRNSFVSREKI